MISVIIPVYNAEPYLRRCLDSVLDSTYLDFELILINDGSTDSSFQICQEYAGRDSRITLLSQENSGVSAARNLGLDHCGGEWVVFVDADDMVSPDFLGLVAQDENQSQDLLLFDFSEVPLEEPSGRAPAEKYFYTQNEMPLLIERTLCPAQLKENGNLNFLSPWAKAYKESIIRQYNLRFDPELFFGEDRIFNLEFLLRAKKCEYISTPVYFYNIHSDSSSHHMDTNMILGQILMINKLHIILESNHMIQPLQQTCHVFFKDYFFFFLNGLIFGPNNTKVTDEKRKLCDEIRKSEFFGQTIKHNRSISTLQGRIHLFFFGLGWYRITAMICKVVHARKKWKAIRK